MANLQDFASCFNEADAFLKEQEKNGNPPPENIRGRLYGLNKQITQGDCTSPCPPESNAVLYAKWTAWTQCKSMSREEAVTEYVTLVKRNFPKFKPTKELPAPVRGSVTVSIPAPSISTGSSTPVTNNGVGSITKEGILYKQRDVFKGWRPRKFQLQDSFLHYYLENDDVVPRKTMELSGCTVIEVKPTQVGDAEYYPFVIGHAKSPITYNLAATSRAEQQDWMSKIRAGTLMQPAAFVTTQASSVDRLLERKVREDEMDGITKAPVVHPDTTVKDIPSKLTHKVEAAIHATLSAFDSAHEEGWELLFNSDNILAKKRQSGGAITVKGEGVVSHQLPEIFDYLINEDKFREIDKQIFSNRRVKSFSPHSFIVYRQMERVWPSSARDYCNLTHWRVLSDNRVVIVSFSEKFDEICPLEEGVVRGELILSGFILKPTSAGTMVQYVVQLDPKGHLPAQLVSLITNNQPLVIQGIRKRLNDVHKPVKSSLLSMKFIKQINADELIEMATKAMEVSAAPPSHVEDGSEKVTTTATTKAAGSAPKGGEDKSSSSAAAASNAALKTGVSSIVEKLSNHTQNVSKRKITAISLTALFIPSLFYYVIENPLGKVVSFVIGCIIAIRYLFHLHHGQPCHNNSMTCHRIFSPDTAPMDVVQYHDSYMILRFPIELGKLLRYLDNKREDSGFDVTPTHIAMKAVGMALADMPQLNGNLLANNFYLKQDHGVDISVTIDVMEKYTALVKVKDIDMKPLEYISNELQNRSKEFRQYSSSIIKNDPSVTANLSGVAKLRYTLLELLPFLRLKSKQLGDYLACHIGITIPSLGIIAHPYGACTIITTPNREGSDADIDIGVLPNTVNPFASTSAPINVTMSGIRVLPAFDSDRKLCGNPVMNFAVTIDTRIGSLTDCRKFCSKLQHYLNNPQLLDKADRKNAVAKEDEKLAQEKSKKKSIFSLKKD